jgi:hypothetical protein
VADGTAAAPVTLRSAQLSAQWCEYLESHARGIYGLVNDIEVAAAARLASKIKEGAIQDGFTQGLNVKWAANPPGLPGMSGSHSNEPFEPLNLKRRYAKFPRVEEDRRRASSAIRSTKPRALLSISSRSKHGET